MKWINKTKGYHYKHEWNKVTVTKTGFQFNTELANAFDLHEYRYVHIAEEFNDGHPEYYFFFVKESLNVSKPFFVTRFSKSIAVRVGATSLAKYLRKQYLERPLYLTCTKDFSKFPHGIPTDTMALRISMENYDV